MVRACLLAHDAQCGHLADTRAQAIHELVVEGGFTNVTHVVRSRSPRLLRFAPHSPLMRDARSQEGGYSAWAARKLPGDWDEE
jgi:hypothetical protein